MKFPSRYLAGFFMFLSFHSPAQESDVREDSVYASQILEKGMNASQVMDILSMLTDVHGPRLSFSNGYKQAAAYAKEKLQQWGLSNVHYDPWGEKGRGWSVKKFHIHMLEPVYSPIVGFPKAWSPGVKNSVSGGIIYLNAHTEEALAAYKGKLKGKLIIMDPPPVIKIGWEPLASRLPDSTLLKYANDRPSERSSRYRFGGTERVTYLKWKMCLDEGALAVLSPGTGRGDNGAVVVSGAYFPIHPDTDPGSRPRPYSPDVPVTLPQVVLSTEHYNRIFRLAEKGIPVRIELALSVEFSEPEEGFNVIAEIPGTDLRDEVVMIGAHLDSWHSGTGTTDNGVGSAVCLEAMRLISELDEKPRRTIRIGLWGGEEQGLRGSRGYVKAHLENPVEAGNFSVYFNMDNGSGKFRGIYLQGNEGARDIFKAWFTPFHSMGAATITSRNTGGTDHLSFAGVGLPGFQFIQDPVEYGTRTHHSSLDVYDKALEDDLKHNAVIMATFAWKAANRDELFPRK